MTDDHSKDNPAAAAASRAADGRGGADPARYIMLGGFLGAGKTTAVLKLAQHLAADGVRVGLITNDQGSNLVDTAMLRSRGFATEEIAGGCFCCRFNSLVDAADQLTRQQRPDVFIAEPVGSCTDLVATVTYPLRRMYGERFVIAPVSVLVDPQRARRVLGLCEGGGFSSKVTYIYRKQLEEADVIVVNKVDQLDETELAELKQALGREFPRATVLAVSARHGDGLEPWFERLRTGVAATGSAMEVDYDEYAEGEALLGWLNATVQVTAVDEDGIDAGELLGQLAAGLQDRLRSAGAEVAHLKMTLSPDEALGGEVAVANLVRNDMVPELSMTLDEPVDSGQMIVNLRAEADPGVLLTCLREELARLSGGAGAGVTLTLEHEEHFRPGRPVPTHRDLAGIAAG